MAIYNPYYQTPNYNGTGTYPLSYQTSQLQNVITGIQGIPRWALIQALHPKKGEEEWVT